MNLGGIVLCGGQSSRMGKPKAWLPFGNELLLQRVVRLLQNAASPVIVVAAPDQDLPRLPDDVIVRHDPEPHRGPLQGLQIGLQALQPHVEAAYVTGCDYPFVTVNWIRFLDEQLPGHDIVVPHVNGHFQPLSAIYRTNLSDIALALLKNQHFRLLDLFDKVRTKTVSEIECLLIDPLFQSLRNVNTPEEYAVALQDWLKLNKMAD
jgi:molybdenum cofactor guanylyltransferase